MRIIHWENKLRVLEFELLEILSRLSLSLSRSLVGITLICGYLKVTLVELLLHVNLSVHRFKVQAGIFSWFECQCLRVKFYARIEVVLFGS